MSKYVVLTFDDGTIYDKKFIELLKKYNLPCTFNLNSGLENYVWNCDGVDIHRLNLSDNVELYKNFEVASHTFSHPFLTSLTKDQLIYEVQIDVNNLSNIFNKKINSFAIPFDQYNEEIINIIKDNTSVNNIRISNYSDEFIPTDPYHIYISSRYNDDEFFDRYNRFKNNNLKDSLFVIAGHSYEFEVYNQWDKIEHILYVLSQDKDIKVVTMQDAVNNLFYNK